MDVHSHPDVAAIDAELVRLSGQRVGAADVFDRQLAELKIDELLERRFELTGASKEPAA